MKSLYHILSVIDARISAIESDDDIQDIYRFLCDLKQFPQFSQQVNLYLDKYFETGYFHEHVRYNIGYTKSNPANQYIWDCFNQQYVGIHCESKLFQNESNSDTDPIQLNNIVRDELFLLTLCEFDVKISR